MAALIELMKEKSVHSITVKALCAKAQVNRATFYGHYENLQDFLDQMIMRTTSDMTLLLDNENRYVMLLSSDDPTDAYSTAIQYVLDNAEFFRAMFGSNGLADFQGLLVKQGVEQLLEALRPQEVRFESKVELDVLANFIIQAELGSLNHYVRSNMKYSARYMAQQILTLIGSLLFALEIDLPLAQYGRQ
ncbi:MAG: TetR family transcriptional regulator C-terminal domain-containing protein [Coriobacteriaceae bacterium]|jgi:AcrR family transcriptional regulator|nr:TetR family transcriptional regulator C-terminal domain-containing protein [Coriobacteriaceae bacterium]